MPSVFGPGTILIPNEVNPNQAGLLSLPGGAFLSGTVPLLQSGEGGAVLSNGTIGYAINPNQDFVTGLAIYAAGMTVPVATPAVFPGAIGWDTFSPIASDFLATFYVGYKNIAEGLPSAVRVVSALGVVGPTTYTLPIVDFGALAVDQANTTLYYGQLATGTAVHRWNIGSNSAGADLVTPSGTNIWMPSGFLVLPGSGTLLAVAQLNVAFQNFAVYQYRLSDGALLRTFPLVFNASGFSTPRIIPDLANPSGVFWVRTFEDNSGATSSFTQFNVVTGAVSNTFTVPSSSDDPTKVPVCCPFFAWDPVSRPGRPGCGGS